MKAILYRKATAQLVVAAFLAALLPAEANAAEPARRGSDRPSRATTLPLTETERAVAELLYITTRLGADEDCTPAPRSGIPGGISALSAVHSTTPNLDDLEASPETLELTGYAGGNGVLICRYQRTRPDPAAAYKGWAGPGPPGFPLDPVCAVSVEFDPPPNVAWDMLRAYVDGPNLTACKGTPQSNGDGGGDLPPLTRLQGTGRESIRDLDYALAAEAARSPEIARLRRQVPAVLEEVQASGRFSHLPPRQRARAELAAVMDAVKPASDVKSRSGDPLAAGCVPCLGYTTVVVGELIGVIAYASKLPTEDKAATWGLVIGAWLVTAGTSLLALHACLPCPPAAAALSYIGYLLANLVVGTLYALICMLARIFRIPLCF